MDLSIGILKYFPMGPYQNIFLFNIFSSSFFDNEKEKAIFVGTELLGTSSPAFPSSLAHSTLGTPVVLAGLSNLTQGRNSTFFRL